MPKRVRQTFVNPDRQLVPKLDSVKPPQHTCPFDDLPGVEFVNVSSRDELWKYWRNDSCTLVFRLSCVKGLKQQVNLMAAVAYNPPDEFDAIALKDGTYIFRLWWD